MSMGKRSSEEMWQVSPDRCDATTHVRYFCATVHAMAELTVYEKRTCTTCKKLAVLLEERGIDFVERVLELLDDQEAPCPSR